MEKIFKIYITILSLSTVIFYSPIFLLNSSMMFLGKVLISSAYKKVGHPYYGYRSKVGLFLIRKAVFSNWETFLEAASFVAKTEGEEIMRAVDVNKVYDYVVKSDRKLSKGEQVVFQVRMLSSVDKAALDDNIYKVSGAGNARKEQILSGTQRLTVLKKCLVGWKNFKDESGNDVAFDKTDVVAMLDRIPLSFHQEIANFISGESETSESED